MKARMISKQLRDAEGLANQMWQGMLEAVLDSEGVCLAAVKRYFGLGNKRMTEFLGCLKEVKSVYIDELCDDGVYDDGNIMVYLGDSGHDLDTVAAWMPIPKPYKETET